MYIYLGNPNPGKKNPMIKSGQIRSQRLSQTVLHFPSYIRFESSKPGGAIQSQIPQFQVFLGCEQHPQPYYMSFNLRQGHFKEEHSR